MAITENEHSSSIDFKGVQIPNPKFINVHRNKSKNFHLITNGNLSSIGSKRLGCPCITSVVHSGRQSNYTYIGKIPVLG